MDIMTVRSFESSRITNGSLSLSSIVIEVNAFAIDSRTLYTTGYEPMKGIYRISRYKGKISIMVNR
jgi:hypothetical protein